MNDYEILESKGQTTLFDFVEVTEKGTYSKIFKRGEPVKFKMYPDEVEYINEHLPHLHNEGVITGVYDGYYTVDFGVEKIKVDGDKLIKVIK